MSSEIVVFVTCILQKDVEKTNSSGYVDEKEIVRLVRRDESHVRSGGSNIVQVQIKIDNVNA